LPIPEAENPDPVSAANPLTGAALARVISDFLIWSLVVVARFIRIRFGILYGEK